MHWALVPLVALLVLAPTAASADRARVFQSPYAGQPVGAECFFELPLGADCPDVADAHVQFGPFPSPRNVEILLRDDSGLVVGAEVVFHDAAGIELGRAGVCETARRLPAPEGTAYARILIDTVLTDAHCAGLASVGTTGVVTLRLR